jgi:serine/threonine protein kinase
MFQPGGMVTPSVRLVRPLGQGGMGSVWIADHLALRTQVVVKFMAAELASNPANAERFSREASAASQVKSQHVVQMLDHGVTSDGHPFIVMELLEGHDLAHHIKHRGALPPPEVILVVSHVSKALARAHERGIVHRDIKPENIFLCDAGGGEMFVKLLDFGIAKAQLDSGMSTTKTGAVMGTPFYMSPEQLMGAKHIDHRTDLWSLGVVAYEALTGARPFEGGTVGALAVDIHSSPVPKPSARNPSLGPLVDDWFAKACARDPQARFGSARELAAGFEAALKSFGPAQPMVYLPSEIAAEAPSSRAPVRLAGRVGQYGSNDLASEAASSSPIRTELSKVPIVPEKGGTLLMTTMASATLGGAEQTPPRSGPRRLHMLLGVLALASVAGALIGVLLAGSRDTTSPTAPQSESEARPTTAKPPKPLQPVGTVEAIDSASTKTTAAAIAATVSATAPLPTTPKPKPTNPPAVVVAPSVIVASPKPKPTAIVSAPPSIKPPPEIEQ